jgi:hypothetical protein
MPTDSSGTSDSVPENDCSSAVDLGSDSEIVGAEYKSFETLRCHFAGWIGQDRQRGIYYPATTFGYEFGRTTGHNKVPLLTAGRL